MDADSQKQVFLSSEGDQWFARNRDVTLAHDLSDITTLLGQLNIQPQTVLEIGCADGKHLAALQQSFDCDCYGIEPSAKAVTSGRQAHPKLQLTVGTAEQLPYEDDQFDLIVFGFCLYLCDRQDLFAIAYQADRCLKDTGHLVIKDFYSPQPFKNPYSHHPGMYAYKMDYSRLFSWSPCYHSIASVVYSHQGFCDRENPNERVATLVLQKNQASAFPDNPY